MSEPVVRGATPEEFDEVAKVIATAFGEATDEWPWTHVARDPNHRPELHRICVADGKIVSALRIVRHQVHYGGAVLEHAGIADVGTPEEFRRQGHSTRCLQDAIGFMEQEGAHFSILYTGIQPFYARLGWAILPHQVPCYELTKAPEAVEGVEVCTMDREAHLAGVRSVYDAFNATRVATTIRSDAYWELRPSQEALPNWLVALTDGEVTAYLCGVVHDEVLGVREYGWLGGYRQSLEALFGEAIRRGLKEGAKRLTCQLGADRAARDVLTGLAAPAEAVRWDHVMVRVVDLQGLLKAAELWLRERPHRARSMPPAAAVNLRWEEQVAGLRYDNRLLSVVPQMTGRAELDMTADEVVQLLFGDGLRAIPKARRLPQRERRLLEAVFPGEHFVFWETDWF